MDVAYHVNNLKITDEIIKEFGEPPKTYAKYVTRFMLIVFAIFVLFRKARESETEKRLYFFGLL